MSVMRCHAAHVLSQKCTVTTSMDESEKHEVENRIRKMQDEVTRISKKVGFLKDLFSEIASHEEFTDTERNQLHQELTISEADLHEKQEFLKEYTDLYECNVKKSEMHMHTRATLLDRVVSKHGIKNHETLNFRRGL